eukprot:TRINITY_DN34220_c0_g1_i1.p1 TRINITY_DN34220_c0_g1~~TRINITY_DN34220_c0_g1_i1.p1  ORF type:complete len:291 (-),score=30.85 TRINITY_DN34220_c0_g1_i1:41-913(-)
MKKFDDMICYLAATDPKFGHIIAVDRQFVLFNRAWCVAEVATGHKLGVKQDLIIHSRGGLDDNKGKLHGLRIQDMKASRAEDVIEILSKIPDVDNFNNHLQDMLLGERGLFQVWTNQDEFSMVARLGQVCRIAEMLEDANKQFPDVAESSWALYARRSTEKVVATLTGSRQLGDTSQGLQSVVDSVKGECVVPVTDGGMPADAKLLQADSGCLSPAKVVSDRHDDADDTVGTRSRSAGCLSSGCRVSMKSDCTAPVEHREGVSETCVSGKSDFGQFSGVPTVPKVTLHSL